MAETLPAPGPPLLPAVSFWFVCGKDQVPSDSSVCLPGSSWQTVRKEVVAPVEEKKGGNKIIKMVTMAIIELHVLKKTLNC